MLTCQDHWGECLMFLFVQLAEGMETTRRPRREKEAERQDTRGRQQWWDKKTFYNFLFNYFCWFDVCLCDHMMALCVQTQTGTAEKRTPRMTRTCYVTHCLSQDPLEWERLLQSMLAPRSSASRYKIFKVHNCVCVRISVLVS